MDKNVNKKQFVSDFVLSAIGLIFMNGILSLVVNPLLGRKLGIAMQGHILFFTSLMGLMAGTFGSAANYARMKVAAGNKKTDNGVYIRCLIPALFVTVIVAVFASLVKGEAEVLDILGIVVMYLLTVIRHYADVEYRLRLDYKKYALYYIILGLGYLIGILLFYITGSWVLIFIAGEAASMIFAKCTSSVFDLPWKAEREEMKEARKIFLILACSYFLSDFVLQADRFILSAFLENADEMTSIYYYAGLVGKMMSLISTPLNGVLSGYLTKMEGGLKRKQFGKIVLLMLAVWIVVSALSVAGSHVFVWLFYRSAYETAKPFFWTANLGQVIFFICNSMMVVVLRYTDEKNQIIVGIGYVAAFFAITVPCILKFGLAGMACGILIVNVLKFILFSVLGLRQLSSDKN